MAKKTIRLNVSMAGSAYGPAGSIIDLDADEADRFIEKGFGEEIKKAKTKGAKKTGQNRSQKAEETR